MANVYCKTQGANQVSFYLWANGHEYFLCKQRYYTSLWMYFSGGVEIHSLFTKSGKHSHSVREAKMKLQSYIEYVEREEGFQILDKTVAKCDVKGGKEKRYKCREAGYNWRKDRLAEII